MAHIIEAQELADAMTETLAVLPPGQYLTIQPLPTGAFMVGAWHYGKPQMRAITAPCLPAALRQLADAIRRPPP